MTDDMLLPTGTSRRSVLKKGALVSSAAALGMASTGGAAAQQDRNVLVFSYEFYPGARFRVVAPLQQSTTIRILEGPEGEGVPEISQPDEYNGYTVSYEIGNSAIYSYIFVRGDSLQQDSQYSFGDEAQVFSSRLNLLQVAVSQESGGNNTPTETPSE